MAEGTRRSQKTDSGLTASELIKSILGNNTRKLNKEKQHYDELNLYSLRDCVGYINKSILNNFCILKIF